MVGYNKDKIVDFISVMDSYNVESVAKKQKVIASFYKLIMSDVDAISSYSKEVVSELLMLYAAYIKNSPRNEKKTYSTIVSDVIVHQLNRSLYRQKNFKMTLSRPGDVPAIQLMSMEAISNSNFSDVIAYLMVFLEADLDTLLVENGLQKKMLERNLFTGDSFAEIKELIDESDNYYSNFV